MISYHISNRVRRLPAVALGLFCAAMIGSADAAVNGMVPAQFMNTAVVTASADQYENNPANNTATVAVLPKGMAVVKAADTSALSTPVRAGDPITYSITATNLGLLGLTELSLTDSIIPASGIELISGDNNNDGILDADEIWNWQAIYAVAQSDIDSNGGGDADIDNTVTVNSNELPPVSASADVEITQAPAFSVEKTADQPAIAAPGTVNYQISIHNTGNQTLSSVTPTDVMPDGAVASLSGPLNDTGANGVLDPNEVWQYSASYDVTQSDIDAGALLTNTVSVVTAETGSSTQQASAETQINVTPSFSVSKSVDDAELSAPATLNYSIKVENTGNVSLTGLSAVDTLPDGSTETLGNPLNDTGAVGVLDVAETWTWELAYPVSQNVIDSGEPLINTIEVSTNEATTQSDSATTQINTSPDFTVTKSVDAATVAVPGLLTYTIVVSNTGNVTLTQLTLLDQLSNGETPDVTGPTDDTGTIGALDVGESWTYTSNYEVTQNDIDAGNDFVNTINVSALETGNTTNDATAVTGIDSKANIQVEKTVDLASVSTPTNLAYRIGVTNTGNVSLNNVNVVDTLPNGSVATLVGPLNDTGVAGTLDVAETWEYTTSYTVTQGDIDNAQPRTNSVVVTSDETGTDTFGASATTTINTTPAFSVVKTVDPENISSPGVLNYTITIDNTGNTTLTDVLVTDTLPDGSVTTLSAPGGDAGLSGALDVGETWTYSTTYTATQQDIDTGETLINSVEVGTKEAGTKRDNADTAITQTPSITLVKAAVETQFNVAGDIIHYAFLIGNNGNLLLNNVELIDPVADAGSIRCLPPGEPVSAQLSSGPFALQPGEQMNCTALHTVSFADVIATKVDNQASVSAVDTVGNELSASSQLISVPMNIIAPLATDDSVISPDNQVVVTLSGAENDTDTNDDLVLSSVSLQHPAAQDTDADGDLDTLVIPDEGNWVVDNNTGKVTFTPEIGFTADPTPVSYTVSDRSGQTSNTATLTIDYRQSAPVAKNDVKANPAAPSPDNPTSIALLTDNGDGEDTDAEGDLDVSTITIVDPNATDTDDDGDADQLIVAGEGVWQLENDTGIITFTPLAGFKHDPSTISYTVTDTTGIVSNEASITVDYPQSAPVANDDEKLEQPLAQPVVVAVTANDSDPEDNLDITTLQLIDPVTGDTVAVLPVANEGVWRVNPDTGDISFTPDEGVLTSPTPVEYTVQDTTLMESNRATVTVTYEAPASISGITWLDRDRDGVPDPDEARKAGWLIKLLDDRGEVIAVTLTDENGDYQFTGLIPGDYTIEFYNEAGVFIGSTPTALAVLSDQLFYIPLPVSPSGVVYDSIDRTPIEGVTLLMVNSSSAVIDSSCLREGQQGQTTGTDGLYNFYLTPDSHASCGSGETYRIEIASVPEAYHERFSAIIRQQENPACGNNQIGCATDGNSLSLDSVEMTFDSDELESGCTVDALAGTGACEVQPQPDPPQGSDDTRYFLAFELEAGDSPVIFNHLPLDARANDAQILLTKTADTASTSIGSVVGYTLTVENLKDTPAFAIEVVDSPPNGFSLVAESVRLIRSGPDQRPGTADDEVSGLSTAFADNVSFNAFDLAEGETVTISYLMRINAGLVNGQYINRASALGPNGERSNEATALVDVVSDPVIGQATLIGKVFFDRDGDGYQDSAVVSGLTMHSEHYGVLRLPPIAPRSGIADDPASNRIVVNMPLTTNNGFSISTEQGTRIDVSHEGVITETHIGEISRGTSSQNIRVCTRYTVAPPTLVDGTAADRESRVLHIELTNQGINETGIAGARLTTVSGLIIDTDSDGRFHIPDIDPGSSASGRNFILKVDPSSLPQGATFTTDNPHVLRLDHRALNRMNFGVLLPEPQDHYAAACEPAHAAAKHRVEVQLESVFFDADRATVRTDQRGIITGIASALREYGGGQVSIELPPGGDTAQERSRAAELAADRTAVIKQLLRDELGEQLMSAVTITVESLNERSRDQ